MDCYISLIWFIIFKLFVHYHLLLSPGSERNINKLTLDGVDVMGQRLAEEV